MYHHKENKTLALATSILCLSLVVALPVQAELSTKNIPKSALSSEGKKVTICHYPPGNPDNYQTITISTSALNTHKDHHDDVFALNGECPQLPSKSSSSSSTTDTTSTSAVTSTTTTSATCAVPSGIIDKVLKLLPESKAVADTSPLLTEDTQANILLKKDAKVKVAFVYEGAGYTNTLSSFTFDKTKLSSLTTSLITEKVVFPNFSQSKSGGSLKAGDTVDLGTITSGSGVGFTIVSNGWDSSKNQLKTGRTADQIFRTVKGLNPEFSDLKKRHTVLLSDPTSQVLVIAIEDLNREKSSYNDNNYETDDDFNDAVLAICVDPWDAIDNATSLLDINTGTSTTPATTSTTNTTTTPPQKIRGTSGQQAWSEVIAPQ